MDQHAQGRRHRDTLDAARKARQANVWGGRALRAALGALLLIVLGIVTAAVVGMPGSIGVLLVAGAAAGVLAVSAVLFGVAGLSGAFRDQLPIHGALWGFLIGLAIAAFAAFLLAGKAFRGV